MPNAIAVNWVCPACHSADNRTTIDDGTVMVPKCQRCRTRKDKDIRCVEGRLLYDDGGTSEMTATSIAPPDIRKGAIAKAALNSELYRQFCTVLDMQRVQSAAGSLMKHVCMMCLERCTDMGCDCPCHPAWKFRAELEQRAA